MPLQSDLGGDVIELLTADVLQQFAACLELFVDFNGLLGHPLMGLFRAAEQCEIVPGRDAFMTVGIQSEAEDYGFAFFLLRRLRHQLKLGVNATAVKRFKLEPHQGSFKTEPSKDCHYRWN